MATKSFYIGPNREKNGNQVVTFGFTYSELRDLDEALYELLAYNEDMLCDDTPDNIKWKAQVLGRISQLQMKVDMYRGYALENLEEE